MTKKYMHTESVNGQTTKVYFSNESPELKKWCEKETKRINGRK